MTPVPLPSARVLDLLTVALLTLTFVATALCFSALPATVPTHFDLDGAADAWAPRAIGAWLLPAAMLAVVAVLRGSIFLVDAEKRRAVEGALRIVALVIASAFAATQGMMMNAAMTATHG